jgi:copper/silver efflux system protein
MPPLDEGSFLWMPTTMPHASLGEASRCSSIRTRPSLSVPEVALVAGKIGRAESALDPAPISMLETVIHYKSEYITTRPAGASISATTGSAASMFARPTARSFPTPRAGRTGSGATTSVRPQDIWDEIVKAARLPGTTSARACSPSRRGW